VQQYQRYFADADRVLILLHNDPDPDALASGRRCAICCAAPRPRPSSARCRA
jgi:nanoRNase/pAp phosphatase (c-di-AMP/oligoRNAs hydrolase)